MFTDPTWFTLSLVISAVGFVLFNYGRKLRRWPQGIAGVALMVYPYFVPTPLPMVGIAAGVGALLLVALRLGL
jgi:predicted cobalt transporter CbtA